MPSQSYQFSFSIVVILLFIAIVVSIIVFGAAIKAFATIGSFSRKYIAKTFRGTDTSNRPIRKRVQDGDRASED